MTPTKTSTAQTQKKNNSNSSTEAKTLWAFIAQIVIDYLLKPIKLSKDLSLTVSNIEKMEPLNGIFGFIFKP